MKLMQPISTAELPVKDVIQGNIRGYSLLASHYAQTWFDDPVMESRLEKFLHLVEPSGAVLDVGCGPGRDVRAITKRGIAAIGIDLCEQMLAEARKRVPTGLFRKMDMQLLSFPPDIFAGLWVCASFHHMPLTAARSTLNEFARILKSKGILGICVELGEGEYFDEVGDGSAHVYRKLYTEKEFARLLREAGFEIIHSEVTSSTKNTLGVRRDKAWLMVLARKFQIISTSTDMTPDVHCDFCLSTFYDRRKDEIHPSTCVLWGDKDLYLIPDIAPLVEGHLLIVSTNHHRAIGAFPPDVSSQLELTKQVVRNLFKVAYGSQTTFFEHGPSQPGKAGACVDHAHLHCLPVSLSLKENIDKKLHSGIKATAELLSTLYQSGQSYIYLEEDELGAWAYPVENLPCQFHRRVVAERLGDPEWDWCFTRLTKKNKELYWRALLRLLPLIDGDFSRSILSLRRC